MYVRVCKTRIEQLLCYAMYVSQRRFFLFPSSSSSLLCDSHSFNGVQLNKAESSTQKEKKIEIQYRETNESK